MNSDPRVVATVETEISPPLEIGDSLDPLRERLAPLMEEANRRVQSAGLDFDDCVLEREADFRFKGAHNVVRAPIASLTDRVVLLKPFHSKYLEFFGSTDPNCPVELIALMVRAVRAPDFPAQILA